jgi:PAS domain S-box-containing protein
MGGLRTLLQRYRAALPALIVVVCTFVVEAVFGPSVVVISAVVLGPLLAAVSATPRVTAVITLIALFSAVMSGVLDDILFEHDHAVALLVTAAVGALSVALATIRSRREAQLAALEGVAGLQRVSEALAPAENLPEVVSALGVGADVLDSSTAILSLVPEAGWRADYVCRGYRDELAPLLRGPRPSIIDSPLTYSLRTGHTHAFETRGALARAFPELAVYFDGLGLRSIVTMPLRNSTGTVVGAFTLGFDREGPHSEHWHTLAAQIAQQASLAVDRALAREREQAVATQMQRLQHLTALLAGSLRPVDVANVLATAGREALGADAAAIYECAPDGSFRLLAERGYKASERAPRPRVHPDPSSPIIDLSGRGGLLCIETPDALLAAYPDAAKWPFHGALIAGPLHRDDAVFGVVNYLYAGTHVVDERLRTLASTILEQGSQALQRALLHEQAEASAEAAIKERDRSTAITAAMQDGLFVTGVGGEMIEVNARFCELTGYSRDEMIGARPPYPWWPNGARPERVDAFVSEIEHQILVAGTYGEYDVTFARPDGTRMLGILTASPLRNADGVVIGAVGTVKDVTDRVMVERRLRVLQRVTAELADARSLADIGAVAVDEMLPALRAQAGGLFVRSRDGQSIRLVHVREAYPGSARGWGRSAIDAYVPLAIAMRTGRIIAVDRDHPLPERAQQLDLDYPALEVRLERVGMRSGIWVPVDTDEHGARAVLALLFRESRAIDVGTVELCEAIAQQCGQALDRARLNAAEHAARIAAERSDERVRQLQFATAALSEAAEPDEVALAVTQHAARLLGADTVGLYVLEEGGDTLELVNTGMPLPDDIRPSLQRIPLDGRYVVADAARSGRPVWVEDIATWRKEYPLGWYVFRGRFGGVAAIPLTGQDRVLGVLVVLFREALIALDRSIIETFAGLAAHAFERATRYATERSIARVLQRSMLPRAPVLRGSVSVATRYRPAIDALQVGGDWYDVTRLDDGRVALTVGDVVGRGLPAAAAMGQLRSAVAALAYGTPSPATLLHRLDRFADRVEGGEAATVSYATIDVDRGVLRYACAGHPPPLLLPPDGPPRFLEDGRSWPLGVTTTRKRSEATLRLQPGTAVLFYTDGLVERRDTSLQQRLGKLVEATRTVDRTDPERVCEQVLERLLPAQGLGDDVALLCVSYDPANADTMHWRFPAKPESLYEVRGVLRRWLHRRGVATKTLDDIVLACDEACANAVEHGSVANSLIDLIARPDGDDALLFSVHDRGSWRPPEAGRPGGHGIKLMRVLMNEVTIDPGLDGTSVTLVKKLLDEDQRR